MKPCFYLFFAVFAAVSFTVFAAAGGPASRAPLKKGFDKNDIASVRKSAEEGSPEAQYYLGLHYEKEKDIAEAIKWYRKAAEQTDLDAQYRLGVIYDKGIGVPQDDKEAVKWYMKAAEFGIVEAQFNLGICYEKGKGVKRDIAEAIKWYRKAADMRSLDAQYELGFCYETYSEVKNYDMAALWYRRAAERGNVRAQYQVAQFYETGKGVEKNSIEAIHWYTKAAEQGLLDAQINLAKYYETEEKGVPRNMAEAIRWYTKAAEQGDNASRYKLRKYYVECGQYYEKEKKGSPPDMENAAKMYWNAVEQGYQNPDLLGRFASLFRYGSHGVKKNLAEAIRWSLKAAEQGNNDPELLLFLGSLYENGRGVEKNMEEAFSWYSKAAELHSEAAQKKLDNLVDFNADYSLLVTTDQDIVDSKDNMNSLREALKYYQLKHDENDKVSFAKDFEIKLSSSLVISKSISIDGGNNNITIIGPETEPMFRLSQNEVSLTLKNLSLVSDYSGNGAGILEASNPKSYAGLFGWFFDKNSARSANYWVEFVSVKDGGTADCLWNLSGFSAVMSGSTHVHRLSVSNRGSVRIEPEAILESSSITCKSDRLDGDFIVAGGTLKNCTASNYGDIHILPGGTCEDLTIRNNGFVENNSGGTIKGLKLDSGAVHKLYPDSVLTGTVSIGGFVYLESSNSEKMNDSVLGEDTDIIFDLTQRTAKSGFSFSPHTVAHDNYPTAGQPYALLGSWEPFKGAHRFTVRVKADQETGTYMLVNNAKEFKSSMSLTVDQDDYPDALSLGKSFSVNNSVYSLSLNGDNTLILTIKNKSK